MAFDNLPNVRFVNRCLDLHLGGVGSDFEQVRRLETGGDGGAGLHQFIDDNAAGRRDNHGAVEIEPRRGQLRRALADLCIAALRLRQCNLQGVARAVKLALRDVEACL